MGPRSESFYSKDPHPPEWDISSAERPPHTMIPHISFRHPTGVCPYLVRDPLAQIRKGCNFLARSL